MGDALHARWGGLAPISFGSSGTPGFNSGLLDNAADYIEFVFQAPAADTITHLGFRYTARTGTPPTYIISLQGVSGGVPDGTIKGGGTPASATFTPPASTAWDATWQWIALDNSYTCTRGEWLSIVIGHSSGVIDGTNRGSFAYQVTYFGDARVGFGPEGCSNQAGSRTAGADPTFGYKSSTTVYGIPIETATRESFNSATTSGSGGDERGMYFTVPTDFCSTYKVKGVRWGGGTAAAGGILTVRLMQTDLTVLQSVDVDTDDQNVQGGNSAAHTVYFDEATLSTLSAGTKYYLTLKPDTVSINPHAFSVDTVAEWDPLPYADAVGKVVLTDGASATETTTTRYAMELILDEITAPTGGGGGAKVLRMTGVM